MNTCYCGVQMKSGELYHWKYKDKYQKNGKWVYIYDTIKSGVKGVGNKISGAIESQKYKKRLKDAGVRKVDSKRSASASAATPATYKLTARERLNADAADKRRKAESKKLRNRVWSKVKPYYDKAAPVVKKAYKTAISKAKPLIEKGKKVLSNLCSMIGSAYKELTKRGSRVMIHGGAQSRADYDARTANKDASRAALNLSTYKPSPKATPVEPKQESDNSIITYKGKTIYKKKNK